MEHDDNKKCYSCGKIFGSPAELKRHKNRKTPCLIRPISEEDKNNPNRCRFCNKIFVNKGNLNKHYKLCKVRNGGMDILVEKIQHEETVNTNVLKLCEKLDVLIKENQDMRGEIDSLKKQLHVTGSPKQVNNNNGVVNNGTINNNDITNLFNVSPYIKPNTEKVKISADDILHNSNIPQLLFERIYFNAEVPENHCLHLKNLKDHCLIYYDNSNWKIAYGLENVEKTIGEISNLVINGELGSNLINGKNGPYNGLDNKFIELPGAIKDTIVQFNEKRPKLDRENAYGIMIVGKNITAESLKKTGCPLLK